MIKNKTILCFASGYDAPPTGKHHIMHLLEKENIVLWVNYHASRTPSASGSDLSYMAKKLLEIFKGVKKKRKNLYVLTPLVIPLPSSELVKKINRKLLIFQIKAVLKKIKKGPLQLWSFTPDISYVLGSFNEEKVLYYCVDDHAAFSGYDKDQVLRDEKELCEKSDLVLTTSLALQKAKKSWNKNTVLVPHGVDFHHFNKAVTQDLPCPEEIKNIPSPKFGFFGLIRDWVDLDLVASVAEKRPDWNFIFIGDADSNVNLSKYKKFKNIYFLGRKKYDELPFYCKYFDAGLIPFKVNELTFAVNPIKLREYLSAGLPVISTPMPEVKLYESLVYIVKNTEEFIGACEEILQNKDAKVLEKRCNAMKKETWNQKLDIISKKISESS
jgi:glycosyltransferase involved in cell wall biosynthesis